MQAASPIELWGGIECTVNRVGDRYRDQVRLSGHQHRASDLDLFAELGLKALRYPVLWERTAPDPARDPDWRWPDERLRRLREIDVRAIVGLVHHGSGPRYTHLLDDAFATGLGRYAGAVAARYPWVEDWTPINEPLTTARFSALYGHWYPHARDERAFWLALLNQIDATRSAMRAIRRVTPGARLIQTDDLGRTFATTPLAQQAEYDNERRWVGWDLLFGRVDRHHPLFEAISALGLGDRLRRIADDPCPPDVIGVNHYLTSDRFLDHRCERYPPHLRGGNGRIPYADTEAIRVLDPAPAGLAGVLRETWQRYATPLAITEIHNGCTREEQLRWAADAWDTAEAVAAEGIDLRAVTAWSLLGSRGWNTLLTGEGRYEPGVYDVSSGVPRATALAALWRDLARSAPRHPVAREDGWWRRPERLIYGERAPIAEASRRTASPPLLILGATGVLGQAFARACEARGIRHVLTGRPAVDLDRTDDIGGILDIIKPWGVVNAAGWVRVDEAETDETACRRTNTDGATALTEACTSRDIGCLNISSDLVFGGDGGRPLTESDHAHPISAYGRSKLAMETRCEHLPRSLIIRTAAFFSPFDAHNFATSLVDSLLCAGHFDAADDYVVSPTFVPALVESALDLLIDGAEGIWHLSDGEATSWADFAIRIARACGHDPARVRPVPGAQLGWVARRPRYAALTTARGERRNILDESIATFARDHRRNVG